MAAAAASEEHGSYVSQLARNLRPDHSSSLSLDGKLIGDPPEVPLSCSEAESVSACCPWPGFGVICYPAVDN